MNQSMKPEALKAQLFDLIERLPTMMEFDKQIAKLTRQKFLALVKEGFTEAQAIELLRPRA